MSYWDSSTGSLTRHELRTVFRRREAEGVLPSGEAAALYVELNADIAIADIVIQPETADMEREFGLVLEACFSQIPPTFIRTNDALVCHKIFTSLDHGPLKGERRVRARTICHKSLNINQLSLFTTVNNNVNKL